MSAGEKAATWAAWMAVTRGLGWEIGRASCRERVFFDV
jgi:hypothetical protein